MASYSGLASLSILNNLLFNLYGVNIPTEAVLSTPVAYTALSGDEYDRDTTITLTMPDTATDFFGSVSLDYSRIDLSSLVVVSQNVITPPVFPFQVSDVLTQLNTVFGTGFTLDDVQNTLYTNPLGPFILTATPGSLAWKNSLSFDCTIPMNLLLADTVSEGLTYSAADGPVYPAVLP